MSNFTKIRLLNGIRLVLIVMPAINYKAKLYDSMLIQSLFDCVLKPGVLHQEKQILFPEKLHVYLFISLFHPCYSLLGLNGRFVDTTPHF